MDTVFMNGPTETDMKENGNFVFVMVKVQTNLQMEMFS